MLDAIDSMHNGEKSQDPSMSKLLARWESGMLNGVAGAKHVKSIYLPSLNQKPPELLTRQADVLILTILKARM